MVTRPPASAIGSDGSVWAPAALAQATSSHASRAPVLQQSVVEVRRRAEGGDAPGWQGATIKDIGNI